ncbi:hypothetical protein Forpe1208_v009629 [Fusarium oxysporum f. sp. rapae]|uniref:VOC domain-containing protein n=2 Tax=Fusarium oxysporum TaxID=5507 RepID=A0A8J5U609_FUSOX|nr:hypothetical protein Forpe1208_v009629 [Fusarium oxysporum f. sp. rapae]
MSKQNPTNLAINHIAISCTDLDGLVKWYREILGFELMGKIQHFKRSEDSKPFDKLFVSYPPTLNELKFAILTSGNGVGIEVFQFIDPPCKSRDEVFEFTRPGVFHICVTNQNPDELLARVVSRGGRQVGDWMQYSIFGLDGHKGIYTQDPWGNVVEIMSISQERVASSGNALMTAAETFGTKL